MADRYTKIFTVQMTPQMYEDMRVAAFNERASMGEVTRRALEAYLGGSRKKTRRVVKGRK